MQIAKRKNRRVRAMRGGVIMGIRRKMLEKETKIETGKEGLMGRVVREMEK